MAQKLEQEKISKEVDRLVALRHKLAELGYEKCPDCTAALDVDQNRVVCKGAACPLSTAVANRCRMPGKPQVCIH